MRYKLMPKFPDYPGGRKTYPKFSLIDGRPPSEREKLHTLLKLTGDELGFLVKLAQTYGDTPVVRRLQVRQLSSLFDSLFSSLNFQSKEKAHIGKISISGKELKYLEGHKGVMEFYKASIKVYARAMGVQNPNGNTLQLRGAAIYWPNLRGRITHPKSLEQYQFTGCDAAIIQAIGDWFKLVQNWALRLQLREFDEAKKAIANSTNQLKQDILNQLKQQN